jgi:hypothetical protein
LGLVRFARTKGDICVALLHGKSVIFARALHEMHDICIDVATVSFGFKRFQAISNLLQIQDQAACTCQYDGFRIENSTESGHRPRLVTESSQFSFTSSTEARCPERTEAHKIVEKMVGHAIWCCIVALKMRVICTGIAQDV